MHANSLRQAIEMCDTCAHAKASHSSTLLLHPAILSAAGISSRKYNIPAAGSRVRFRVFLTCSFAKRCRTRVHFLVDSNEAWNADVATARAPRSIDEHAAAFA